MRQGCTGCFGAIGSLVLFGGVTLGLALFALYGPESWLIGFIVGTMLMAALLLVIKFAPVLVSAWPRNRNGVPVGLLIDGIVANSDDPDKLRLRIGKTASKVISGILVLGTLSFALLQLYAMFNGEFADVSGNNVLGMLTGAAMIMTGLVVYIDRDIRKL